MNQTDIRKLEASVEALLFASGEPIPVERMAQVLETDRATLLKVIARMSEKRESKEYGVGILRVDDCFQMATKAEYADIIRQALDMRRNMPLSPAAMETLAIIAYNQPVTKGYIEEQRGVDSGGIVSLLVSKGLVEERGRMELPGRPIQYGTTLDFLRSFGLATLNDLPRPESAGSADGSWEAAE